MLNYTKLSLLLSSVCLMGTSLSAKEKGKTPNLLFIMADQWRGNAIGYLNIEPVKTPN
ncbi:MAG TPA: sulfatase, partial [Porphyromonadaceae bacterium]|nr:sulfatase [Porphyromonadaceae bacterium]